MERTQAYKTVAVQFSDLKNNVVDAPAGLLTLRLKLYRETMAGTRSDDLTPLEKLDK
jgi:hypothetical protein